MTGALLLLLLDTRSPAGAHNHSAAMEAAITTGTVRDLSDVEAFCRTRLATSGRVAADFAAAAAGPAPNWDLLDAEFDARTPSEAMRASSRQLGRGLARMVRSMLPGFTAPATHHPLVLGAAVAAAGGTPELAARAAALGTVSVPASAALRLLGLDPFGVQGLLARLAAEIDAPSMIKSDLWPSGRPQLTLDHGEGDGGAPALPAGLAADSAPALDLLADFHLTTEVRLFAS